MWQHTWAHGLTQSMLKAAVRSHWYFWIKFFNQPPNEMPQILLLPLLMFCLGSLSLCLTAFVGQQIPRQNDLDGLAQGNFHWIWRTVQGENDCYLDGDPGWNNMRHHALIFFGLPQQQGESTMHCFIKALACSLMALLEVTGTKEALIPVLFSHLRPFMCRSIQRSTHADVGDKGTIMLSFRDYHSHASSGGQHRAAGGMLHFKIHSVSAVL